MLTRGKMNFTRTLQVNAGRNVRRLNWLLRAELCHCRIQMLKQTREAISKISLWAPWTSGSRWNLTVLTIQMKIPMNCALLLLKITQSEWLTIWIPRQSIKFDQSFAWWLKKEAFFPSDLRYRELITLNNVVEQFAFLADRVTESDTENQY